MAQITMCKKRRHYRSVLNCRWNLAPEIKSEIDIEYKSMTVQEAVNQGLWKSIPCLVRHFSQHKEKTFALEEATRNGQWECVLELIRLGLSEEQKEQLCQKILSLGQWDCALELSKQNISTRCRNLIIDTAFEQNRWRFIMSLFKIKSKHSGLEVAILKATVLHRQWNTFTRLLILRGIKDCELAEVMNVAAIDGANTFLHKTIRTLQKGRRVFKQLCRRKQWSRETACLVLDGLYRNDEMDLSFHVAVTHGIWKHVLHYFEDDRISQKSRRFAFLQGVKQGTWENVVRMARKKGTRKRDRCFAFLDAARRGELEWAVKLYKKRIIADDTVEMAVKLCISQQAWSMVLTLCTMCQDIHARQRLLAHFIEETAFCEKWILVQEALETASQWGCEEFVFTSFAEKSATRFSWEPFMTETRILTNCKAWPLCAPVLENYLGYIFCSVDKFEKMLKSMEYGLLSNFIDWCVDHSYFNAAAFVSIVAERWEEVSGLIKDLHETINNNVILFGTERAIENEVWEVAVVFIECGQTSTVDDFYWEEIEGILQQHDPTALMAFAQWCKSCNDHSKVSLTVFLYVVLENWNEVSMLLTDHLWSIDESVVYFCVKHTIELEAWEIAAKFMQLCSTEDEDCELFHWLYDLDLKPLFETLKQSGQHSLIMWIAIQRNDWDIVEKEIDSVYDYEITFDMVEKVATKGAWNIVSLLLDKCKYHSGNFSTILRWAVGSGELECAKKLLERIDPASTTQDGVTLLQHAVFADENVEDMVRLCISAGVSSHQRHVDIDRESTTNSHTLFFWGMQSPMRIAIESEDTNLVKLLYTSGSCSNHELHNLRTDAELRAQINDKDISEYLDKIASNPRTLKDLCCLTVSHHVGSLPGRCVRVRSLPVPTIIQNLILFEDILH